MPPGGGSMSPNLNCNGTLPTNPNPVGGRNPFYWSSENATFMWFDTVKQWKNPL
jgi:hypothetical protein